MLQNNKDITVHQENLQIIMNEVYKIVKDEAPAIMKKIFRENIVLEISKLSLIRTQKYSEMWVGNYATELLICGKYSRRT